MSALFGDLMHNMIFSVFPVFKMQEFTDRLILQLLLNIFGYDKSAIKATVLMIPLIYGIQRTCSGSVNAVYKCLISVSLLRRRDNLNGLRLLHLLRHLHLLGLLLRLFLLLLRRGLLRLFLDLRRILLLRRGLHDGLDLVDLLRILLRRGQMSCLHRREYRGKIFCACQLRKIPKCHLFQPRLFGDVNKYGIIVNIVPFCQVILFHIIRTRQIRPAFRINLSDKFPLSSTGMQIQRRYRHTNSRKHVKIVRIKTSSVLLHVSKLFICAFEQLIVGLRKFILKLTDKLLRQRLPLLPRLYNGRRLPLRHILRLLLVAIFPHIFPLSSDTVRHCYYC